MNAADFLKNDLESIPFLEGVDRGKWGIAGDPQFPNWPYVYFWVQASGLGEAHALYHFRFDMSGHNTSAPIGNVWDIEKNEQLAEAMFPRNHWSVTNVI